MTTNGSGPAASANADRARKMDRLAGSIASKNNADKSQTQVGQGSSGLRAHFDRAADLLEQKVAIGDDIAKWRNRARGDRLLPRSRLGHAEGTEVRLGKSVLRGSFEPINGRLRWHLRRWQLSQEHRTMLPTQTALMVEPCDLPRLYDLVGRALAQARRDGLVVAVVSGR